MVGVLRRRFARTREGVFTDEPLHVDLRWAGDAEGLSLREARFLDRVASLAAPLHSRSKQDLVGEDVRQHRRTVLLARAAVGSLAALAAAASIASVFAIVQRNEARVERDRAEMQQKLATARLIAAQARVMLDERPDRALLLAATAVRTSNDPDARDALLRALQRTSNVAAYMEVASPVHGLAFRPDGRLLATGNQDRTVQLWNVRSARPRGRRGSITSCSCRVWRSIRQETSSASIATARSSGGTQPTGTRSAPDSGAAPRT